MYFLTVLIFYETYFYDLALQILSARRTHKFLKIRKPKQSTQFINIHEVTSSQIFKILVSFENPIFALILNSLVNIFWNNALVIYCIWKYLFKNCFWNINQCIGISCDLQAAMYGTSQSIPDRSMVAELAGCFVSSLYTTNKSEESNGTVPTN